MSNKRAGERRNGEFARAARRFRHDPVAMVALVFLILIILAAIFNGALSPYDPAELLDVEPFSGPSGDHWLGTDGLGRDVLSRLLEGASVSLRFSLFVVLAALAVAIPTGLLSGYVGGWLDAVLMRIMDGILSFPALVLAIAIVGVLGPSLLNAGIAVTVALIPGFARLTRGQSLAVREEVFVDASRAIGTSTRRILWRHLLPNVISPLIVQSSVVLGFVLLAEAGLSFLGLGVQAPTASWGSMLKRANDSVLAHPWGVLAPGIAIVLTVLAFNLIGEGMRSALGGAAPVRKHGRLGLTAVDRPSVPSVELVDQEELLVVEGLTLEVQSPAGPVQILDDVSFSIKPGETLGLVGESGSGKTVTSLSIMRLLPSPAVRITGGSIRFEGRDLLGLQFNDMAALRGSSMAMIFQDPMASLNPAMTVGQQIAQVVRWHEGVPPKVAEARMLEALELVSIPRHRAASYPHEFSGGMRQRAMIAMALVCRPRLLIADEPTTALDVTIQAQILELLRDLRAELGMSMLFVSHDLGVVADICDRVAVMYAGQVVETAGVRDLFYDPQHPYSTGLLRAMPQRAEPRSSLYVIPGQVPLFSELEPGCRLASRCEFVQDQCRSHDIALVEAAPGHLARCVRSSELRLGVKA